MNYLTYEEYTSLGGVCEETAFNRNIDLACSTIDKETFGRVAEMAEIPQRVKVCCRDLVEYYSNHTLAEKEVTSHSESAGGISESVGYVTKSNDDILNETKTIILQYLFTSTDDNSTPLLYKGAMK